MVTSIRSGLRHSSNQSSSLVFAYVRILMCEVNLTIALESMSKYADIVDKECQYSLVSSGADRGVWTDRQLSKEFRHGRRRYRIPPQQVHEEFGRYLDVSPL